MKKYISPVMEISTYEFEDILTASGIDTPTKGLTVTAASSDAGFAVRNASVVDFWTETVEQHQDSEIIDDAIDI